MKEMELSYQNMLEYFVTKLDCIGRQKKKEEDLVLCYDTFDEEDEADAIFSPVELSKVYHRMIKSIHKPLPNYSKRTKKIIIPLLFNKDYYYISKGPRKHEWI